MTTFKILINRKEQEKQKDQKYKNQVDIEKHSLEYYLKTMI